MEDKVAEQEAELVEAREQAAVGARARVEEAEGQAA
jgi:hypothetical protein